MSIICIIPARGGSKGIPLKNIVSVAGKPLLAHSIEQAKRAPEISRIFVSTDAPEIAEVATQYGAETVWRPNDISGDTATSESALLHTLDHFKAEAGRDPDLVVFLQATSPLRRPDDIHQAIETLQQNQADSLLSMCPLNGFVWRKQGDTLQSLTYDYQHRQRRQDVPQDYIENGSIYIFKPWVLRQLDNRLGGKIVIYPMRVIDYIQVDTPEELEAIRQLMPAFQSQSDSE